MGVWRADPRAGTDVLGAEGNGKGREATETCHPPPASANTVTLASGVGDTLCAHRSPHPQGTAGGWQVFT